MVGFVDLLGGSLTITELLVNTTWAAGSIVTGHPWKVSAKHFTSHCFQKKIPIHVKVTVVSHRLSNFGHIGHIG